MAIINFIKGNKKFTASFTASLFALIGLLAGLSVEHVLVIIGPLGLGYPVSQGLADFGKEGKKLFFADPSTKED